MNRLARIGIRSVAAVFACSPLLSQASYIFNNNPGEQRLEMSYASGVVVVFDAASQKVSVKSSSGQVWWYTFAQVAQQAAQSPDNQQNLSAAAFVSGWTAGIRDLRNVGTVTGYTEPTLNLPGGGFGGGGGGSVIINSTGDGEDTRRTLSTSKQDPSDPTLQSCAPYQINCDPWAHLDCTAGAFCNPFINPYNGRIFYLEDSGGGAQGPLTEAQQMCRAMHFDNWSQDQEEACGDMAWNFAYLALGTVGAIASCPATFTGLGALGCGAASGLGLMAAMELMEATRACNAHYPGHPSYCD